MSDIHINRAGQNLGIFSQAEVQAGLNSGRFLGADLAWRSGLENWKPLSQWPEFTIPAIVPPSVANPPIPTLGPLTVAGPQNLPSWEQRDSKGFLSAFGGTIKEVLLEPSATFSHMRETGGLMTPFFFLVISTGVGVALSFALQLGVQGLMTSILASQNSEIARSMAGQGVGLIGLLLFLFVALPLGVFINSFIGSGLWHIALMILGGANKSYEATYRVYCYAKGAAAPLGLVPCCGPPVAFVWGIVSGSIGLSKVHQISTGKAVLAILLPLILCCALLGMGMFALYQALASNPDIQELFSRFSHR